MIEHLTGTCIAVTPKSAVIECHGVGYGVEMNLAALCDPRLTSGLPISLWITTHVREDSLRLFGFFTYEERQAFEVLTSVSGVGPKVALAILSTLSATALYDAVVHGREVAFRSVPGVGPRLSERLIVELKPLLKKLQASRPKGFEQSAATQSLGGERAGAEAQVAQTDQIQDDVASALENLGFREKDISVALNRMMRDNKAWSFPELLRGALLELAPQSRNP